VWVAIADHWEPCGGGATDEVAAERVARWVKHWPEITRRHADYTGRPPQYTFSYPQEEYWAEILDALAKMKQAGIADVDVHIHHDGEGQQNFVDRMSGSSETLVTRHGLLRQSNGRTVFGFIHGNWSLDNSRPDGKWCGLNNEITLLRDLGCYADFTMPSGASPTQSRTVNSIYWVCDDPLKPRSYDYGVPVKPGDTGKGRPAHDHRTLRPPLGSNAGSTSRRASATISSSSSTPTAHRTGTPRHSCSRAALTGYSVCCWKSAGGMTINSATCLRGRCARR